MLSLIDARPGFRAAFLERGSANGAAPMQETIDQPLTMPEATSPLVALAERTAEWAGEPFLHPEEDAAQVLAPGTARRRALDDALAEIEAGRTEPTPEWKIRYALMLGLERVLSDKRPQLRSGTELRRHQVDALAGMLTELIAAAQRDPEPVAEEPDEDFEDEDEDENGENGEHGQHDENGDLELDAGRRCDPRRPRPGCRTALPLPPSDRLREDDRRRRLRRGRPHDRRLDPHAPPPARLAVQPRAERRGLRRAHRGRDHGQRAASPPRSDHDPDLRVVRAPCRRPEPRRVPARHLRRGTHGARREDERGDPQLSGARLHRDDGDRAADRQAGLGRLPRLGRRPAAGRRRAERSDRAASLPARSARRGDQLGADRRRRLRPGGSGQGARPRRPEPGRREPLPQPLRLDSRRRLRRRCRARLQPRAGIPRRRSEGRGRQRSNAAGPACRDPRRVRGAARSTCS